MPVLPQILRDIPARERCITVQETRLLKKFEVVFFSTVGHTSVGILKDDVLFTTAHQWARDGQYHVCPLDGVVEEKFIPIVHRTPHGERGFVTARLDSKSQYAPSYEALPSECNSITGREFKILEPDSPVFVTCLLDEEKYQLEAWYVHADIEVVKINAPGASPGLSGTGFVGNGGQLFLLSCSGDDGSVWLIPVPKSLTQ